MKRVRNAFLKGIKACTMILASTEFSQEEYNKYPEYLKNFSFQNNKPAFFEDSEIWNFKWKVGKDNVLSVSLAKEPGYCIFLLYPEKKPSDNLWYWDILVGMNDRVRDYESFVSEVESTFSRLTDFITDNKLV